MQSRSPEGRDGMVSARSITDLSKRIEISWEGGLILKNSLFPTKLLLTEGDQAVVRQLMQDENAKLTVAEMQSSASWVARAREAWRRKMRSRRRRVVAAPEPPEASSRAYEAR